MKFTASLGLDDPIHLRHIHDEGNIINIFVYHMVYTSDRIILKIFKDEKHASQRISKSHSLLLEIWYVGLSKYQMKLLNIRFVEGIMWLEINNIHL